MLTGILEHLLQVAPKDIVYYIRRNHRIFSSVDNFKVLSVQRAPRFVLKSSGQDHIFCRKEIVCLGLKPRVV